MKLIFALLVSCVFFLQNVVFGQSILARYTSPEFKTIQLHFKPIEDSIKYYYAQSSQPLLPTERTLILSNYSRLLGEYRNNLAQYIEQNSNNSILPQWLNYSYFEIDKSPDWNKWYLQKLVGIDSNNIDFQYFKQEIESIENIQIGKIAPNFTLKNKENIDVSLSEMKENYILINFWASWCAPCRAEHPELKKLATESQNKAFRIVEISLDDNRNNWLNAISQDQLNWPNLWSPLSWDNKAARKYGIHQIPQNVLIDKNGIILGKNVTINKVKEILLRQN